MKGTSRTGLQSSPTKKLQYNRKKSAPHLKAITGPAPFVVKPFAGLYNPYPNGCSLLCNHPADLEARKMIQKAKDNWTNDGKSYLFPDEVAAIRAELEHLQFQEAQRLRRTELMPVESVPEELFRKYTETDSRPLTPAPTLASAHTRTSTNRRCVTPDPMFTSEVREKTLLVLDLRKSHSQETLSWYGSSHVNPNVNEPPIIKVVPAEDVQQQQQHGEKEQQQQQQQHVEKKKSPRRPKSGRTLLDAPTVTTEDDDEDKGEEMIKRRGKRRKKKGRDSSRGPSMFHTPVDPETLVAAIGPDSQNASARPSLIPNACEDIKNLAKSRAETARRLSSLEIDSFLDYEMLRQLRRELTAEITENEFGIERRKALEEALKTVPKNRSRCAELVQLQKTLNLPKVDTQLWLSLPRMFKRSAVRFELPMDSRTLINMSPMQYVKENVVIGSLRKMLYNFIFNIFKIGCEEKEEGGEHEEEEGGNRERLLSGKNLPEALGAMMGQKFTNSQLENFKGLMAWDEEESYDFKTFCGMSALCERLLAKEFYPQLPDRTLDPCNEIEKVDFESLERRLHKKTVDERLIKILHAIKNS